MQSFKILTEDDRMSDSLVPIMENDQSLRSSFSGPDFPKEMVQGLLYYQPEVDAQEKISGKGKLYICINPEAQNIEEAYRLLADLNIDMATQGDLVSHIQNQANPHGVTASQINCYDKAGVDNIVLSLAKKDLSNVDISSYPQFAGATSTQPGKAGILSAPKSSEFSYFLRADGTWQPIKQGYEGFPIGYRMDWDGDIIPDGWIEEAGQILNREDYPEGWTFATTYGMVVTDVSWINNHLHGKFSSGDGVSTFRMPDRRNCFTRYNTTDIGLMKNESVNNVMEVNYRFNAGGATTISIPNNGDWSGYVSAGAVNTSSGWPAPEVLRFRKKGGETYPQHIISRSIRKMK